MKIALLLRGIAYNKNYTHPTGRKFIIDFRKSINNYNEYIFNTSVLFKSIDVFYHTYLTDGLDINLLNSWLNPISYSISMDPEKNNLKPNQKFNAYSNSTTLVLNLFIDYCTQNKNITYDHIILTRFDLIFKVPLFNLKFHKNNFMISCLSGNKLADDNFFVGDIEHYKKFLQVLCKRNNNTMMHCDYTLLCETIGVNNITFLFPGIYAIYKGCPLYNILRNFKNGNIFNGNEILIFNYKAKKFLIEEYDNVVLKSILITFKIIMNNSFYNIVTGNKILGLNEKTNKFAVLNNDNKYNKDKSICTNFKINAVDVENQLYTIECGNKFLNIVDHVPHFTIVNLETWNIFVTNA